MLRKNGILLARFMLGSLFFFSGLGIVLGGLTGTAGMISSLGIPAATLFAVVIAFIKVVGGLCLMIGYRTGLAAASLIAFTLAATIAFHLAPIPGGGGIFGFQVDLWKNLSIIGGLLYAMAYGPGDGWSMQQKGRKIYDDSENREHSVISNSFSSN